MNALFIVLAAIVLLLAGYRFYGRWLSRQWGIDPARKTPAQTREDGMDYVPARSVVLMGHHFSSIAGAGPINGPIMASVFGWVPVFLWCVIGGIFAGGLQDYGALFASVRNDGKSLGEIISKSMGKRAKLLFILFALLVTILVVASFVNVVAGTFYTGPDGGTAFGFVVSPGGNQTTALISVLFIFLAVVFGLLTHRFHMRTLWATLLGLSGIAGIIALGLNVGFAMGRTGWIVFTGAYITVASVLPVWVLLRPRDYLSSFLLYAMMAVALVGIAVAAFTGTADFRLPAFTGWSTPNGTLFPTLFITVACGACSGFHALFSTGTTSKQLDNEAHARPIAYGSMLIECVLGVISLIAVGMVFSKYTAGLFGSPSAAFAGGIGIMFAEEGSGTYNMIYALLTLSVSVFALTSLDSATRLCRFMVAELLLKEGEKTWRDASGLRRFLTCPLVCTVLLVIVGCVLGGLNLNQIWGLFGAANQLLSGLALMAVASWLGEAGKNNRMFFIPMGFMLLVTLVSLSLTVCRKLVLIGAGNAPWGDWFQLIFAAGMAVLAVFLVIEGIRTFRKQRHGKPPANDEA